MVSRYTDEHAALQAKKKMLREDWEFFTHQRKILKQQVMKSLNASKLTGVDDSHECLSENEQLHQEEISAPSECATTTAATSHANKW